MLLVFFGVVILVAMLSFNWWQHRVRKTQDELLAACQERGLTESQTAAVLEQQGGPIVNVPQPAKIFAYALVAIMIGGGLFNKVFFYAEPGYIYHVRTILGEEKVVDGVASTGYNIHLFGRINAWKRALTVQASLEGNGAEGGIDAERDGRTVSASLPPLNITFLDQVDANASATARFRLPTDRESFLRLVHEYRSPENLLRTSLIPTFNEVLTSTAQLMGAEEFYSGGRTEFNNEFDNQLRNGIYIVRREEIVVEDETVEVDGSANASLGEAQQQFGDNRRVIFVVNKQYDENGVPVRKQQTFTDFGIQIVEARVTDMRPNQRFIERMQLKQKASADRAIAREQRIQEEEQRLLAIARGEREVAERQASAKVEQIERTTNAETERQLAVTEATKLREQMEIARDTAEIELEKARLEAQTIRTLADAEADSREMLIQADGALAQKLEALVRIAEVQANALANRNVPEQLFLTTGVEGGSGGMGNDAELIGIMQTQLLKNIQTLNLDMSVNK